MLDESGPPAIDVWPALSGPAGPGDGPVCFGMAMRGGMVEAPTPAAAGDVARAEEETKEEEPAGGEPGETGDARDAGRDDPSLDAPLSAPFGVFVLGALMVNPGVCGPRAGCGRRRDEWGRFGSRQRAVPKPT